MPLTFQMIPRELWQKIFTFLDLDSQNIVSRVSVDFFQLIVSLWKSNFLRDALKIVDIYHLSTGGLNKKNPFNFMSCLAEGLFRQFYFQVIEGLRQTL